ncbi:hypothetical protein QR685DRAFT_402264, partial [Neurospora intermedia]
MALRDPAGGVWLLKRERRQVETGLSPQGSSGVDVYSAIDCFTGIARAFPCISHQNGLYILLTLDIPLQ